MILARRLLCLSIRPHIAVAVVDKIKGVVAALANKLMTLSRFLFRVLRWRFWFGRLMSDEAAVKAQLGVVGASGYKRSVVCANIYGTGGGALPEALGDFRCVACSDTCLLRRKS